MSLFDLAAILVTTAAAFGVINHLSIGLPSTIGLVVIALVTSLCLMAVDSAIPALGISETVRKTLVAVDLNRALLHGMLGFLLFAGALHVDLDELRQQRLAILLLASVGTALSAGIVGAGFAWITGLPLIVAFLFGALISPTDPVAVLGLMKEVAVPKSLEAAFAGESLFNDGIGYVLFLAISMVALGPQGGSGHPIGAVAVVEALAVEVIGGVVIGAAGGWLVFQAMRRIDDYRLEVLLTLALVMGIYALALHLGASGPIAVVIAGLFIGDTGVRHGMSEQTRQHVHSFWRLLDEILNAVLFLIVGFEIFAVSLNVHAVVVALAAIPLVLAARFAVVSSLIGGLRLIRSFPSGAIRIMTWGGLRGGISIALVLSLPRTDWKPMLLTATYAVVIFSIVVQGLSMKSLLRGIGVSRHGRA